MHYNPALLEVKPNRRDRLDDPEGDWENVMWSDEIKLELFGINTTWFFLEEEEC